MAIGSDDINSSFSIVAVAETELKLAQVTKLEQPCSALSWRDNRLLVGTGVGTVTLYSCAANGAETPKPTMTYNSFGSDSSMDEWPLRPTVRELGLNPADIKTFASTRNNVVAIWNLELKSPIFTQAIGTSGPLFSMAWNPQHGVELLLGKSVRHRVDEYHVTHLKSGSGNGTVSMLDARLFSQNEKKSCVALEIPRAHDSCRAVAYSPLVLPWIATGGYDGEVKLWDVRSPKFPFLRLVGHHGPVSSVSFSPSRPEQLISGSADKSIRHWSLNMSPSFSMAVHKDADDMIVVSAKFSHVAPHLYFGLTSAGHVKLFEMKPSALRKYAGHRALVEQENQISSPANGLVSLVEEVRSGALVSAVGCLRTHQTGDRRLTIRKWRRSRSCCLFEILTPLTRRLPVWRLGSGKRASTKRRRG